MNILLNWFPPAFARIPSPSMSILKSYLTQFEYEVDICYWNIILRDLITNIVELNKWNEFDEIEALIVFISIISKDDESFKKLCLLYQVKFPQYFNLDKEAYYENILLEYGEAINSKMTQVLIDLFKHKKYNLVGVNTTMMQLIPANVFAKILKDIDKSIPIAVGGVTSKNEAIALLENFDFYDFVIWGEGENQLHQLCRYINNEIPITEVSNIVYRNNGNIITSTYREKIYSNINNIIPDFSDYFFASKAYKLDDIHPFIPIETTRGCHWQKCKFCFLAQGYKTRSKENDAIIHEIEYSIQKYNIFEFIILDTDMIFNQIDKFNQLLDKLIQIKNKHEEFKIWNGEIISKDLDSFIVKKMKLAGFVSVQIGYEASCDNLLKKINKKNTFSSNLLFIKWASQYEIEIQGLNVITGLLEEDDNDIITSAKNLHYLRFYLERDKMSYTIIPLLVMKSSRYYKIIEEKKELSKWNVNVLYNLYPKSYIKDKHKYDLMYFASNYRNPLWDYFESINAYYTSTNYKYKIFRVSQHGISFQEYIENELISKIEFNTKDEYYWNILEYCNNNVRSIDDIYYNLHKSTPLQHEDIKNILNELNNEYLLYSNDDYSENVTIINTDLVL